MHAHAKLGIAIGSAPHHGRGMGSEAIRLLIDFAFTDLNLNRVYLDVIADNFRAIRAYQKCGFQHEGVMRDHYFIDGRYIDAWMMAINRADWQPGKTPV